MDAYYAFESLLQPTLQSSKGSRVSRPWLPIASADPDLRDIFPQHHPLFQSLDDAWTLQELANAVDAPGGTDKIYDSNTANVDFVSVGRY